jgi:hypothetical protein
MIWSRIFLGRFRTRWCRWVGWGIACPSSPPPDLVPDHNTRDLIIFYLNLLMLYSQLLQHLVKLQVPGWQVLVMVKIQGESACLKYQSLSQLKDLMWRVWSGVHILGLKEGEGLVNGFSWGHEGWEAHNELLWRQESSVAYSRLSAHKILPQRQLKSSTYFEKLNIKDS